MLKKNEAPLPDNCKITAKASTYKSLSWIWTISPWGLGVRKEWWSRGGGISVHRVDFILLTLTYFLLL